MDINAIGNASPPVSARSDAASVPSEVSVAAKNAAAPVQTAVAVEQPKAAPSPAQVSDALKSINKAMQNLSQGLEFTLDEDSQRTVIKVVDSSTKEVIRQIPTKEALEISKALDQVKGLLIKQTA